MESIRTTATFTRPNDTTAYAAADLVSNSTTPASVVPLSLSTGYAGFVKVVKLAKSNTSLTNASFRVHLFSSSPATITNGDNGAFSVSGVSDYIGAYDVYMNQAFTDGACGFGLPVTGDEHNFYETDAVVVGLIEALAAYTPAANEVFTLTLETYRI